MKDLIETLFDPWNIGLIHIPLFFCAWIGCWIGTMGAKRPSAFMRTLTRGMVGGAVGGFLNPMLILMYANGLMMYANGMVVGSGGRMELLVGLPLLLTEGAVLSLPLGILIAARKRREPPIHLQPPA